MTRDKVLSTIQSLPVEFSLEELFEKLVLLEMVEKGLQQVRTGQVLSHEQAARRLKKWLK